MPLFIELPQFSRPNSSLGQRGLDWCSWSLLQLFGLSFLFFVILQKAKYINSIVVETFFSFHKNGSLLFKGIVLLWYLAVISLGNVHLQIYFSRTNSNPLANTPYRLSISSYKYRTHLKVFFPLCIHNSFFKISLSHTEIVLIQKGSTHYFKKFQPGFLRAQSY